MSTQTGASFQAAYRDLLLQFLAELMNATHAAATPETFQRDLKTYCDDLRPWLTPEDVPSSSRASFPLFAECTIDENKDKTTVCLSPEGEALFRAWLRRQTVLTEAGRTFDPGRAH